MRLNTFFKVKEPRIEPYGTPAFILLQLDFMPLRTTRFLLLKKTAKKLYMRLNTFFKFKESKIKPCGTPALILLQLDFMPLRTTRCFLLLK